MTRQVCHAATRCSRDRTLLWLLACQYLAAGHAVDAILDTTPHKNRSRALAHLPGFLVSPYLRKGLRLLLAVRGRMPIVPGVTELRADGGGKVESVSFRTADGGGRTLPVDTLLLHQGVVPNVNLAMSAGVEHRWDDTQSASRRSSIATAEPRCPACSSRATPPASRAGRRPRGAAFSRRSRW